METQKSIKIISEKNYWGNYFQITQILLLAVTKNLRLLPNSGAVITQNRDETSIPSRLIMLHLGICPSFINYGYLDLTMAISLAERAERWEPKVVPLVLTMVGNPLEEKA